MDLILWRHADAEDGSPDSERQLTEKGIKQASRMAKWLRRRLPPDAEVVASPAVRAQQTARALTRDFKTVEALGTSASAQDVLTACRWPGDDRTIVVIGHQPTLGEAAALLLTGRREQWSLRKGAIVWVTHGARDADARAQLYAAIAPDLL
jgi:phosphohistidine phosphatase